MIRQMAAQVRNMIKRAATQQPMVDSKNFPIVQVKYFNHTAIVEVLAPYGFCSSPPVGSLATIFSVGAQEENRTAVIDYPTKRFKNLEPGEVAVGNYLTLAKLYFRKNGDVELFVPHDLKVTVQNDAFVNITGNLNMTVDGDVSAQISGSATAVIGGSLGVTAAGATITCPDVLITGNLRVDGDITDNAGSNSDTIAEMREIYNIHTHNETGTVTLVPNQEM